MVPTGLYTCWGAFCSCWGFSCDAGEPACPLVRGLDKLNQDCFTLRCSLLHCVAWRLEGDCILLVNILRIEVPPTLPGVHWVIKSDLKWKNWSKITSDVPTLMSLGRGRCLRHIHDLKR